jgi:hypothetical protein
MEALLEKDQLDVRALRTWSPAICASVRHRGDEPNGFAQLHASFPNWDGPLTVGVGTESTSYRHEDPSHRFGGHDRDGRANHLSRPQPSLQDVRT